MKLLILYSLLWNYFIFFSLTSICNVNYRIDCKFGNQQDCEKHGCCWNPIKENNSFFYYIIFF